MSDDDLSSIDSEEESEILAQVSSVRGSILARSSDDEENEETESEREDGSESEQEEGLSEEELLKLNEEAEKREVEQETGDELIAAAREGDLKLVREILSFAREEDLRLLNIRTQALPGVLPDTHWSGCTALMTAARAGHAQVVKHLVEVGSDLELFDLDRKMTALMWAAHGDHVSVIKELHSANHEETDIHGSTALTIASELGNKPAMQQLLLKSDVNARDKSGQTPLTYAVLGGHYKAARLLCDYSADVNIVDKAGRTPLMHAARWGFVQTVDLLIDRGADLDKRCRKGWTAVMFAARWNKLGCVKLLLENEAELVTRDRSTGKNAFMWAASSTRNLALLSAFLDKLDNFDILQKDIYGKTALDLCHGVEAQALLEEYAEKAEKNKQILGNNPSMDETDSD